MKTEIAALCLSIKFKQDLHSPQKLIIFAVGKVTTRFPFFYVLWQNAMQSASNHSAT